MSTADENWNNAANRFPNCVLLARKTLGLVMLLNKKRITFHAFSLVFQMPALTLIRFLTILLNIAEKYLKVKFFYLLKV